MAGRALRKSLTCSSVERGGAECDELVEAERELVDAGAREERVGSERRWDVSGGEEDERSSSTCLTPSYDELSLLLRYMW